HCCLRDLSRWVDYPKIISARTGMEARLGCGVGIAQPWLDVREFQKAGEEQPGFKRMMLVITRARVGADQQSPTFAEPVLNRRGVAVLVLTRSLTSGGFVLLKKVTPEKALTLHLQS